jgi:hypothetical protein
MLVSERAASPPFLALLCRTTTDSLQDSTDGLSVPLGACRKVWIVFPPSKKNLALLAKQEGRKAKVRRIGQQLEGGVIFETTSAEAVYLPVGCIHAVFTTVGGFLNALDFTTPDSIKTYPALFEANVDRRNHSFEVACLKYFLESVDLGLDGQQEEDAIAAWVEAGDRVREHAAKELSWKAKATAIWNDFLNIAAAKKMVCPCGGSKRGDFVGHFRACHLWKVQKTTRVQGVKSKAPEKPRELVKPESTRVLRSRRKTDMEEDAVAEKASRELVKPEVNRVLRSGKKRQSEGAVVPEKASKRARR